MGRTQAWLKHTGRPPAPDPDPVSAELARSVRDVRNATLLKKGIAKMSQAEPEWTTEALLRPILETLGQKVRDQLAAQGATASDDVIDHELKKLLNRLSINKVITDLVRAEQPPAPPVPTTTTDLTQMATAAVNIHQGVAETMRQTAEDERQRRLEAEESVSQVAASVRQDEQAKAASTMEWMGKTFELMQSMTKEMYEQRLAFERERHQEVLERLEKTAQEAIQKVVGAYEDKLAVTHQLHEKDKALIAKDFELEKTRLLVPHTKTPQERLNETWAEIQAQKMAYGFEAEKRKDAADAETQAKLGQLLDTAIAHLPTVVTGLVNAGSPTPQHGIPGTPPPPPEAGGDATAPAPSSGFSPTGPGPFLTSVGAAAAPEGEDEEGLFHGA